LRAGFSQSLTNNYNHSEIKSQVFEKFLVFFFALSDKGKRVRTMDGDEKNKEFFIFLRNFPENENLLIDR
jgi:hypothetical protein